MSHAQTFSPHTCTPTDTHTTFLTQFHHGRESSKILNLITTIEDSLCKGLQQPIHSEILVGSKLNQEILSGTQWSSIRVSGIMDLCEA